MLWTVSELNRYVREKLEVDEHLQAVQLAGEISGLRAYPSGHWYFTLKDAYAQVSCVMWRSRASALGWRPRDGDAVTALGHVSLYEARGQFQFDVALMQPAGEGELYRQFVYLKAALEAEGLFAPERKRPLPAWPHRIGVVTSPVGAAVRDILNVIGRRCPLVEVIVAPTAVQGVDAPPQIVAALQAVCDFKPDVILLARGGGSLEDLWCFNHEAVARAVAACPVPVVCGVGHETDFTIADFAADLRAPTPSAAAELVTPDGEQLLEQVAERRAQLAGALRALLQARGWALAQGVARLRARSPEGQLRAAQQRLDDAQQRAARARAHQVQLVRERWRRVSQALGTVSPRAVLARGYAVVSRAADDQVVRSVADVAPGMRARVRVTDGEFVTRVEAPAGAAPE
jgi:exodeoxyribonuclease VII large subunit